MGNRLVRCRLQALNPFQLLFVSLSCRESHESEGDQPALATLCRERLSFLGRSSTHRRLLNIGVRAGRCLMKDGV